MYFRRERYENVKGIGLFIGGEAPNIVHMRGGQSLLLLLFKLDIL